MASLQRQAMFEQDGTKPLRDQASSADHSSIHPVEDVRTWQANPGDDFDAAKITQALHETRIYLDKLVEVSEITRALREPRTYLGLKLVGLDWESMAPTDASKCYEKQYRELQTRLEQFRVQENRQGRCPRLVKRGKIATISMAKQVTASCPAGVEAAAY
ncbi:MAG: hypothetical protein Q9184_005771 [Pyrenodesmia sp. 2 TL-2023]